jgi:hypothetical protein
MTIQEAIKSGKPFKRCDWESYCPNPSIALRVLYDKDLLATDWVIEDERFEVTRRQLEKLALQVWVSNGLPGPLEVVEKFITNLEAKQ